MRRLTLILSDLYFPEEAAQAVHRPAPLVLPNLSWLLRFASSVQPVDDWRRWLAAELRLGALEHGSIAPMAASAFLDPALANNAWIANPVHLSARLDHVRLVDRGLIRVSPDEQSTWCAEFARQFAPQYLLHPGGPRG